MTQIPNFMPELITAQERLGLSDTEVGAAGGITSAAWTKAKKRGVIPKFNAALKIFVALKQEQLLINFLKSNDHDNPKRP